MVKKLKITILTDKSSWMNEYSRGLAKKLIECDHEVKLISSKKDIINGDIIFFLSCFDIIPKEILSLNKNNIVVHASKLPEGKGWSPASWQILEGKNQIPITLFEATEKVDAGDIYLRDILKLDGTELIKQWREKLGKKIIEMSINFINRYDDIIPQKQIGEGYYYKKRSAADSKLDINKTLKEQFNLLRVVDNDRYPAFFIINNKKYVLKVEQYAE